MPLGAVRLKDLPRVGGKAAHLGEMIAAGLPVPSGFVVTTDACKRFMQSDPRIAHWLEILGGCDPRDPAALRAAAEEVRRQLSAIVVPDDVADAIAAAMVPESAAAVAVRSSATVEDLPEASFAGQHDSFLNVLGRDAVLAAVKRCWISLFSEQAISYRTRKGVAADRAQMAVVVQQLIDADAAGVMFTTDPAGGDSDSILIEAAFGLGEIVVQGKVTPDRVAVSRSGLRVVRRDTGSKRVQIVAAKDGVCEQLLAAEKAGAPVLEDAAAARLARLGLEVERVLGGPLDIEWGVRGGEIWLLQARPVTTLPQGRQSSSEDRQVWTNANVGEALPDVVTPITWSVYRPLVREVWRGLLGAVGIQFREEQWIGLIAGRVYFNYNSFYALGRRVPGLRDRGMEDLFGGRQDTMLALKQIRISEADLPRIKVNRWRMAAGLPIFALGFLLYSPRRGKTVLASVRRANDELALIVPGSLSDGELLTRIRASSGPEMLSYSKTVKAFTFGLGYSAILFGLCEQWFGPEGRSTANRLMAGIGDREHAEAGYELWLLAEQAARESEIKDVVLSEHAFTAFVSRLEGCRGGRAFLAQWKAFMHRHGHHARSELELSNPRWSECPDFVLDMVRGYVEAINAGHASPIVRQEALSNQRVALEKKCIGGIRNPLKRAPLAARPVSRAERRPVPRQFQERTHPATGGSAPIPGGVGPAPGGTRAACG